MEKSIAVLGTGAVGGTIGADLTVAGYDVLLVDQWPAHVEAMKAQGLHVNMLGNKSRVPVQAFHLCDLCSLERQFDIVFLACKSYDTCWMADLIKPYLKSDGVLVSAQNSLNDEWIAPIIGHERDIGCALSISAEVFEPGLVKRNTDHLTTRFVVGELDGKITPRIKEVAQILSAVGQTEISTNIWGAKWTKLVVNTMVMTIDLIGGTGIWEMAQNHECVDLCIKIGMEAVQVGVALEYVMEPLLGMTTEEFTRSPDKVLRSLLAKVGIEVGKEARSCTVHDLLKGRTTEIRDYINGLVVKKGQEVNVPTPFNKAAVYVATQIEQGKLKPTLSNLQMLERYV